MNLIHLIYHPAEMSRETLYELRSFVALYPYHQTARLLMLKNLYILHDNDFNEELHKAALYLTDRSKLFDLVEAKRYILAHRNEEEKTPIQKQENINKEHQDDLIDKFLDEQPPEETTDNQPRRKPTPADATIDYVSYLLDMEREENSPSKELGRTSELIDSFINQQNQRLELDEEIKYTPDDLSEKASTDNNQPAKTPINDKFATATLANIYIKQGQYADALEIIKRLNLNNPKKSIYFADQIRFLEKLVKNSKNK